MKSEKEGKFLDQMSRIMGGDSSLKSLVDLRKMLVDRLVLNTRETDRQRDRPANKKGR